MNLRDIASACRTDKGRHGYADEYQKLFPRDYPIRLLEIGILHGASLGMWRQWFKEPTCIVGIDLNPIEVGMNKVHTYKMNQTDKRALADLSNTHGPWDLVIDDGSHLASHQIKSFQALWPFVEHGGWYAIEDLHALRLRKYQDQKRNIIELLQAKIPQITNRKTDIQRLEFIERKWNDGMILLQKR